MKELIIPPYSVFVGHGYVHHAGSGCNGSCNLRYHIYLLPSDHGLRDSVSFALGWSIKRANEDSSSDSDTLHIKNTPQPNTDDVEVDNDAPLFAEHNDNTGVDDIQQG